ncbi:MAG: hypothetical protein CVU50_10375 [Candidatus Cloacimonetes bacterium HGW-Cloacimonetes-3]|nr:MAG: hypothetical protein CVU50_10375 [Candidatus Cloacimonetes bacterium HGW-Cloacimonetes-3]
MLGENMMTKLVIICAIIVLSSPVFCQTTPNWLWVQHAGETDGVGGQAIATDSSGNSYVTGAFHGTAHIGTNSLTSNGDDDVFIAKLDNNGNYVWLRNVGGTGYDYGYSIAIDDNRNSYVTGRFEGTAIFGTTTLTSCGGDDIFVAKLDTNGNYIWAKKAGGQSDERCQSVTTDSSGNCYITGWFDNTVTFGTISLTCSGAVDIYIAKLDSNGNYLWAWKAGGIFQDLGNDIVTDSIGNCYITGWFINTVTFGTITLTSNDRYASLFIVKLDTNGYVLWAKQAGGTNNILGKRLAVDTTGNSYVTGNFEGTAIVGSTILNSTGNADIFITKLDSFGNFLWAKQAGGTSTDNACGIAIDEHMECNVMGSFTSIATFGTTQLISRGYSDIFVEKLDTNGNFKWVKQAGGAHSDYGNGIATDISGNSYVTGYCCESAMFDSLSLTGNLYGAFYVAMLPSDGTAVDDELIPETDNSSHLRNAYPNPFHKESNCQIKAEIPMQENGVLSIYNLRGQVVESHQLTSGAHEISFSGKDLAPGIYFYRLKTPTVNEVKKLILLR